MAGIVASTLRRKAFHRRHPGEVKPQLVDATYVATYSPTISRRSSRSSASLRTGFDLEESRPLRSYSSTALRGAKLCLIDFWPNCATPSEQNIKLVKFDTFDTLVPKANAWLLENSRVQLVKCETVEKKITSVDQLLSNDVMFKPIQQQAIYVKGLRLWYVNISEDDPQMSIPTEVGYMNVIPKCIDWTGKYPVYESLPETYAAIDAYLTHTPLEGKIVTIETLPIKLPVCPRRKPDINPDQTCFVDEFLRHILYITRIYFRYGAPEEELIGAQDFLPDFDSSSRWFSAGPKYKSLTTAMRKLRTWLESCRFISITNIQTLEAECRKQPEQVDTGQNLIPKSESCMTVKFVRVTYVRTDDPTLDSKPRWRDQLPGFSYKTFTPAPIKVAMCSGAPEYEPFNYTWERSRAWISCVSRRILSVESITHPLTYLWHNQDGAETTVMNGDWTSNQRNDKRKGHHRSFVHLVRVYMDGDFQEPSQMQLPPIPMVEEIKDCACIIT